MSYVKNASTQNFISAAADVVFALYEQVEGRNAIDDIIIINGCADTTATLTHVNGVAVASLTDWTVLRNTNAVACLHFVIWRRATAVDELPPELTFSVSSSITAQYISVYGCPTGSTPIGNTSVATGTSTTPTWSTIDYSANSTVLFLSSLDGATRVLSSPSTGLIFGAASSTANSVAIKKFYPGSGSTGSVTATMSANDGWHALAVELLDNGNAEVPLEFSNVPAEPLGITTHASDNAWRDRLTTAQVDPRDGSSIANTKTFDASTNVDTTLDTITITGHGYKTGTVVKADANGNTLPTGITDGAYYFVHVVDVDTIKLMLQNAPITVATANISGGYYDDDTTPPTADITATGSGTCRLINSKFMFIGFNSTDNIIRPAVAIACHHNIYCLPIKFSSPKDMSEIRLATSFSTSSGSTGGDFFVMLMDSDGDYKTWKVATSGKALAVSTNVFIRPDNTSHVYEYGTFNSAAVEYIMYFYQGLADDGRLNAGISWKVSTSELIRKAVIVGGTGTINGTWLDVYYELQLYTTKTAVFSSLASSQLRLSHVLQLGDGTNQLAFSDLARALSFDPASDGVISLTRYYTQNGILLKLSASDSVTIQNELLASDASYDWKHDAASNAAATVNATSIIYSGSAPVLRTGDVYANCTFTKCSQISAKGATLTNSTVKSPVVSAGQAAVIFDTNCSQSGLTVDVTGTSTPYHMALDTGVTAITLTDVTFTGTPTSDKIHVLRTTDTVTITTSGTTSLVAGDITSDGATVVLAVPTADLTVTSSETGSLIQVFTTGTQTLLASTTGTELVYTHSGETVDIVVGKAGFIMPPRVVGLVLSGDVPVGFTLTADPVYDASHGLTYTTDASWSRASNQLTVPTFGPTGRQVYSLMVDSFLSETSLRNTDFNLYMNGPNSMFLTDGAEGATEASITNMKRCGVRYVSAAGAITAEWSGVLSIGTATGFTGEYQQVDGSGTTDARATGVFDQLIKVYGDVTHGNFDYRDHLVLKYQPNGYRPVRVDVLDTYAISALEPTLYVIAMAPVAIDGFTTGDPGVTGLTITKHATPQSYDAGDGAKDYSITITDTNTNSATKIHEWLNYNMSLDATFQGLDPFNWPEMVIDSGSHETVYGIVEGDGTPARHGVYVTRDGSTPHPDFTRFQADNGTYGTVPIVNGIDFTNLQAGSQVVVFETGTQTEVFRDNNSSTSESTGSVTSGTYDYTIMKAGFDPIRVTGVVVGSSVLSVTVAQTTARAYTASSGLSFGTTATIDTGTKRFAVTVATTVQNWYSFWIEAWIAQATLANTAFPITPNGSSSFSLDDDYEFTSGSIQYLSRDGFRYFTTGDAVAAQYAALQTPTQPANTKIFVLQQDGGSWSQLGATGTGYDGVLQVFGDATHGNFDYTTFLALKACNDGYTVDEWDVINDGGVSLVDDSFYFIPLSISLTGEAAGNPGALTVTVNNITPTVWNGITVGQEIVSDETGSDIIRYITWQRYQGNLLQFGTLASPLGSGYQSNRGRVYDGTPLEIEGCRVVLSDNTTPHPEFSLFEGAVGETYVPPARTTINVPNILDNSKFLVFIDGVPTGGLQTVSGGNGISLEYTIGVDYADADPFELWIVYCQGTTAKLDLDLTGSFGPTSATFTFTNSQEDCPIYNFYGFDGSTFTTDYDIDTVNDQVDIIIQPLFDCREAFAYLKFAQQENEAQLLDLFGEFGAEDAANLYFSGDRRSLRFDNTTALQAKETSGVRWYAKDVVDGDPTQNPTSGGGGIKINYYGKVYLAETGVSGLTAEESAKLTAIPSNPLLDDDPRVGNLTLIPGLF